MQAASLGEFAPHLRAELIEQGGMVLFDGLDEVPDPENWREQIKQSVQDFSASFHRCLILVTSRTDAYARLEWKLNGFAETTLLPFTLEQVEHFIDAWFAHMHELARLSQTVAEGLAASLKCSTQSNPRIAELAVQPLLLNLIARLHTEKRGALPEIREELYAEAVKYLLTEWEGFILLQSELEFSSK